MLSAETMVMTAFAVQLAHSNTGVLERAPASAKTALIRNVGRCSGELFAFPDDRDSGDKSLKHHLCA